MTTINATSALVATTTNTPVAAQLGATGRVLLRCSNDVWVCEQFVAQPGLCPCCKALDKAEQDRAQAKNQAPSVRKVAVAQLIEADKAAIGQEAIQLAAAYEARQAQERQAERVRANANRVANVATPVVAINRAAQPVKPLTAVQIAEAAKNQAQTVFNAAKNRAPSVRKAAKAELDKANTALTEACRLEHQAQARAEQARKAAAAEQTRQALMQKFAKPHARAAA